MIKKVLIFSVLITLFFPSFKEIYAKDRVVVSSISSDEWYDHIYLLADKSEDMTYTNFSVQVGLGGELLYKFPKWYNSRYSPKLFNHDLNGDKLKDIVVVLTTGGGTSISIKDIHILNQIHDPYRRFHEVPIEPINKIIKRWVRMEKVGNNASILIGKKKYTIDVTKLGYNPKNMETPWANQLEDYVVKDGKLIGSTVVFISPSGSVGSLEVEYYWNGKAYTAKSVTFFPVQS
ncbi:hypothetical protein [Neobacillus sp. D3-1R]|uniref:hypothetical protein n=1 Tax=Neobacillus sp. D3-1R TaxID=3445778 RepID=UPI003FA0E9A9